MRRSERTGRTAVVAAMQHLSRIGSANWLRVPILAVLVALATAADGTAEAPATGWETLDQILAEIVEPVFPERDFSVTEFGAKGDGSTPCRAAIEKAIRACHESGGGRVVVPEGTWLVDGPIHLLSNVDLHVAEGAVLRFSPDPADYLPVVPTRFEGTELMNYSPMIYAYEQENIAITGAGTLEGGASKDAWWPWKGPWGGLIDHGWSKGDPNQLDDVARLTGMADEAVPSHERVFGEGHMLRPNFVQPYRCKNVLIEGITLTNSPMWVLHPVLCENVTVRGVTVDSHGPNNDGCNPESCRNVLIEDCYFNTGDDCIAIKSGRNADGRRIAVPSENIIIRNCTMKDGHGGVVMGSEMSGGIRNVFAENCFMDSPHLDRAIRLKSNSLRGGYLENLFVRNIDVGTVGQSVLSINLHYSGETGEHFPYVRNIYLEGVTVKECKGNPLYLRGLAERPMENIVIANCIFERVEQPSILENVGEVLLKNVSIYPNALSPYANQRKNESTRPRTADTGKSPEDSLEKQSL